MLFYISLWLGKIINALINMIDKKRGSNYSGQIILKICPDFLTKFKSIDHDKLLFITGTNGKSSTNNLINHILKSNGKEVVSNLEGANLLPGIITSFVKAASLSGKINANYFVFEVDERYLPIIHKQLPAKNILITNIQKDQVQRNGDPDYIYRKLLSVCSKDVKLFLNNNEPRSFSFSRHNNNYVTYGAAKHGEAFSKPESFPTMPCPVCGHGIAFEYYNNDGIGSFKCTHCDYGSHPNADYEIDNIDFSGKSFTINKVSFNMPYDVPFMCYNYAAAIAAAKELAAIDIEDMAPAFHDFKNIGGRYEAVSYKAKTIKYLRMKQENPDTFQSSINNITFDKGRKMVCLGLGPITDIVPAYTNTFYTYDCCLDELIESDVERYFCFSEAVCYDIANRLLYAGVPRELITVIETDDVDTILSEIDKAETDNIYLITWLYTFEAMKRKIAKQRKGIN